MSEVVRTVGRYEILREVGRGGMAIVYLARQTELQREVALKELAALHLADPAFAARFERESRLAGSLNHPNIVTVHDYFVHDRVPYIAMEYAARGSLRPRVGQLSLAQVLGVLDGVLSGLAHAHERGVVHRDLKPENLMVTDDGRIKIADFGIAKALDPAAGGLVTATGLAVGTPAYMAPEQAMAEEVGPWTDLYSTGVIAYELLLGRVPFPEAETPVAILMHHVNDPIPAPRSLDPGLDQGLAAWIERLLAKSAGARPSDAAEAGDALEEIAIDLLGPRWKRAARLLDGTPAETIHEAHSPPPKLSTPTVPAAAGTVRADTPTALPPLARRRRVWIAALVAVAALLATGVAALVLSGSDGAGDGSATPQPRTGPPTLTAVAFAEAGRTLTARLELAGTPVQTVSTTDSVLSDGSAHIDLRAPGIQTQVFRTSRSGVTLRVPRPAAGRMRVHLTARQSAFLLAAVRRSPEAIVLELRKLLRPTSAQAAVTTLIEAWKAGDRPAALTVADGPVVTKLFRIAFPEPAPLLQDCGSVGTGQIECAYEYDFGRRVVGFKAFEFRGVHRVLELSFIGP